MSFENNDHFHNMRKNFLICKVCGNFFDDPVYLPCYCVTCKCHVSKMINSDDQTLKCSICDKTRQVPVNKEFQQHKEFREYIEEENHLTEREKELKSIVKTTSTSMQELVNNFNRNEVEFTQLFNNHVDEIKKNIIERRDELINTINGICNRLITEKVKIVEQYFTDRIQSNKINLSIDSIQQAELDILSQFNSQININQIETKIEALKTQMVEIDGKLANFEPFKVKLNKYQFRVFHQDRFRKSFFGRLTDDEMTLKQFEEMDQIDQCIIETPATSGPSSLNENDTFHSTYTSPTCLENNSLLNESFVNLEAKESTKNNETPDKVKSRKRLNIENDSFSQESSISSRKSPAKKKKKEVLCDSQKSDDSEEDLIILDEDDQMSLELNEASFFISGSEDKTCKVNQKTYEFNFSITAKMQMVLKN
jgi:hypothetical protein